MKKSLFIAAAALALFAACQSEVTITSPQPAISFQVANYVPETKANVKFDGTSFTTYAWFHDAANSGSQAFMTNETVKLQDDGTNPAYWSPDRTYFWPKTGYINFFSYAGTPAATSVTEGTVVYGNPSTPTYVTIEKENDPLLASGAYRYSSTNYNNNSYGFQYGTNDTDVTGVPTLFHHLASKVSFVVEFDASDVTDTKNKWELTIEKADFNYSDEGYLSVSLAAPSGTDPALSWPYSSAAVNWTAETGDNATITAPASYDDTNDAADAIGSSNKLTAIAGTDAAGNGAGKSVKKTIFREISVLPQTFATTSPYFAICYTLKHYYDNNLQTTETVNLTDAAVTVNTVSFPAIASIPIANFYTDVADPTTKVTEWDMNYKYVYTVTIKPNHTITFSPAVVDWETGTPASYVYPNS